MHDAAWTGEYFLHGEPIHALGKRERAELQKKHIGFVFQSYHLLDHLTVYENLDMPLSYRDVKKKERDSMVCDMLDRFQIVGKKDLYPSQLSGGQQQLVAVARALIAKPTIILADEPTGNLHSEQGREIMELFQQLNAEGTTIIQVTHSEANAAFGTADRAAEGRLAGERLMAAQTPRRRARAGVATTCCTRRGSCSPTTRPTCCRRCACCSRRKAATSRRRPRPPACWPPSKRATSTSR